MDDLLFARLQMAWSLGFHIVFAVIGIGMPVLMAIAEYRWLRYGSEAARELTKRWAKGTAIFFAVGAVSGTVLSFELGLLWPDFMRHAGGIIEAGWIVTEVGRQPWIIAGVMRTSEAVTPMPGLVVPFVTFLVVYLGLGAVVAAMLVHQVRAAPVQLDGEGAGAG